jgi:hypothetical protein
MAAQIDNTGNKLELASLQEEALNHLYELIGNIIHICIVTQDAHTFNSIVYTIEQMFKIGHDVFLEQNPDVIPSNEIN